MKQLRTFQLITESLTSETVVHDVCYATSFAKAKEFFEDHFTGKYVIQDFHGKRIKANFNNLGHHNLLGGDY